MSNLVIPDGGNIGSASDTDAIAISSGGNVTLSQTLDGGAIGSAVTMSANQACVKTALNASGSAPIYACRAWVSIGGTGTVNIHGSGNVSSVTDNGSGDYTVNFTTALEDDDYACSFTAVNRENGSGVGYTIGYHTNDNINASTYTTSSVRVSIKRSDQSANQDLNPVSVAIFR